MQTGERNAAGSEGSADGLGVTAEGSAPGPSAEAIERWLVSYVAELLDVPEGEVDTTTALEEFGLDSIAAVAVISALEKWLGHEVELGEVSRAPTIASIARLASARA